MEPQPAVPGVPAPGVPVQSTSALIPLSPISHIANHDPPVSRARRPSAANATAVAEKKAAILGRALQHNPGDTRLLLAMLEVRLLHESYDMHACARM